MQHLILRGSLISTEGMAELPDLTELDQTLKPLAIAAKQHPPGSLYRKQLLEQLIRTLIDSNQLARPRRNQFKNHYAEIYAEAKQQLFYHLCHRIDDYDPDKGEVLQWANYLLEKRFFIEASRWVLQSIPRGVQRLSIDDLEKQFNQAENPVTLEQIYPERMPLVSEQVIASIRVDPDGLFQKTHVMGKPSANFQFLALRIIEGYSWQETADQLGIPLATLNRFYHRCLAKFSDQIQTYILSQPIPNSNDDEN
ncbi:sigma-70 family RNA polymerase sigma factor [Roseofilum reptotaenium CS-1145]|nr:MULTISPECIES: sigma-70 family RNA polymerase sigma factor [Roseofilum]MBP0026810.1 sigma-70 family RNA polymerase sigma factor [Roseofilum sp. Guam]MDB9516343.1 sigma-70 family RNA polymerase sigma factor [Roseofilum reptotaenium CS-1145]